MSLRLDASVLAPEAVEPAYLSWGPVEPVRSYGDDVCDFASAIGRPMDEEQRLALRVMYAVREDDRPSCFEFGLVAARQNIKTATFEVAALYDLFVARSPLGVWTAHKYDTTKESFLTLKALIEGHEFLSRRVKKIIEAIGDQHIELHRADSDERAPRLRFRARSLTGGRGLTTRGRLFLDEAFALRATHMGSILPTMSTFRSAQVLYGSSAGMADSDVLRGIRDRGRAGRIGYLEFCAPTGSCRRRDCRHEKLLDEAERVERGCALDNPEMWRRANPAMEWPGRAVWRISQEYIGNERAALDPLEFARERLGWWDEPGLMSLFAGWPALADQGSSIARRLAFAVVVSPDRSRSVVAAAGLRWPAEPGFVGPVCERRCGHDSCHGAMHLEPLFIDNGTGWVAGRVAELVARHGRCPVVVATNGQAAALLEELKRAGVAVTEMSSSDVMDADAQLFDDVEQGLVRHMSYPELDAAIERAEKRQVGRRWVFEAREDGEDVAVLQAVSQAAWASRNVRPRRLIPMFATT